jgi:hypothetical protein
MSTGILMGQPCSISCVILSSDEYSSKIAITIESGILAEVDALAKKHLFPHRSRAIQEAILK